MAILLLSFVFCAGILVIYEQVAAEEFEAELAGGSARRLGRGCGGRGRGGCGSGCRLRLGLRILHASEQG